jgi:acyl carrier protein
MNTDAIWETLTQIFRDLFEDNELNVNPNTTAEDIDGWDSLTHIQLMVIVEQAFGTHFNTGEIANLANVGEMVELLVSRIPTNISHA